MYEVKSRSNETGSITLDILNLQKWQTWRMKALLFLFSMVPMYFVWSTNFLYKKLFWEHGFKVASPLYNTKIHNNGICQISCLSLGKPHFALDLDLNPHNPCITAQGLHLCTKITKLDVLVIPGAHNRPRDAK